MLEGFLMPIPKEDNCHFTTARGSLHLHICPLQFGRDFLDPKFPKEWIGKSGPYHLATLFSWVLFYVPPFLCTLPELAGGTGSVAATGNRPCLHVWTELECGCGRQLTVPSLNICGMPTL